MPAPRLYFTVTNDLSFDQRMSRICGSLAANGYEVTLVGRKVPGSIPLIKAPYRQKRLNCLFKKGFGFYAEFNLRLFFYLLFRKMDLVCSIDLDTILPGYLVSRLKRIPRVYDAHELFCEMKEIVTRPAIYNFWKSIERTMVPQFKNGYTVNQALAAEFYDLYQVDYKSIRNLPLLSPIENKSAAEKYIIYQGAVNEGRCFETLIPAMVHVPVKLVICGEGNFMQQAKDLVNKYELWHKIIFKGNLSPAALRQETANAYIGVNLIENKGLNNYLSLANRFFDYMQAGLPQLCVGYPSYEEINNEYGFALLINVASEKAIVEGLNELLNNDELYVSLHKNALLAREKLNWNIEEKKLLEFYRDIKY